MGTRTLATWVALTVFSATAWAQNKPVPGAGQKSQNKLYPDAPAHVCGGPKTCKTCAEAVDKALESIKSAMSGTKAWNALAEQVFAGLAFMLQGSTTTEGKYSKELSACVQGVKSALGGKEAFNENWLWALGGLFLAEVYKQEPSDEIKKKLEEVVTKLEQGQEPNGGWCHHKGFMYNLANKKVGDLGILTGLAIAALGDIKACKIDVPQAMVQRAYAYCEKASDGQGLIYGVGNPVPDYAGSRGAGVVIGAKFAEMMDNKVATRCARGVKNNFKMAHKGHAFPPLHFFNCAVGMFVLGDYTKFKQEWVGKLLAKRETDGSIWLVNDEGLDIERTQFGHNVISTAIFAIILQLENKVVFGPPKVKPEPSKKSNQSTKN